MQTLLKTIIVLVILSLAVWLFSSCFAYSLDTIFGKDVPWYADLAGGIVLNGVNIPLAVVCWIVRLAGVETPLMGS